MEFVGRSALGVFRHAGGLALVAVRLVARLPRLDRHECVRALHDFGNASVPVILATAGFTGVIMVLQGALYVQRFGVYDLVGWYTGFATFREIGPVLVALMFSGRVGASYTSEVATMRVTDQLAALEIMAIDVYAVLLTPRSVAMVVSSVVLLITGNAFAVVSGSMAAKLLLDLDFDAFARSLISGLDAADFLLGVQKAFVFGCLTAVVSTHAALRARKGAMGVGAAVNAQVVSCAVAIFAADYVMTSSGNH
ncbi:MAG: ABC transporter permease [Myxococcota bacterium]